MAAVAHQPDVPQRLMGEMAVWSATIDVVASTSPPSMFRARASTAKSSSPVSWSARPTSVARLKVTDGGVDPATPLPMNPLANNPVVVSSTRASKSTAAPLWLGSAPRPVAMKSTPGTNEHQHHGRPQGQRA